MSLTPEYAAFNYELAKRRGYTGTMDEWLADLHGAKGDTGTAATVTVGTVTTGDAGTDAAVTNSGDTHNAVLNFVIPRGAKGDDGAITNLDTTLTQSGRAADAKAAGDAIGALDDATDALDDFVAIPETYTFYYGYVDGDDDDGEVVSTGNTKIRTGWGAGENVVCTIGTGSVLPLSGWTIEVWTVENAGTLSQAITKTGESSSSLTPVSVPAGSHIIVLYKTETAEISDTERQNAFSSAFTGSLRKDTTLAAELADTGAKALASAKSYTDGKVADLKTYTDGEITSASSSAVTTAQAGAKTYTDGKVADLKTYTDGKISDTADGAAAATAAVADDLAAAVASIASLEDYVDAKSVADRAYADAAVAELGTTVTNDYDRVTGVIEDLDALDTRVDTAEDDIDALEARFPIQPEDTVFLGHGTNKFDIDEVTTGYYKADGSAVSQSGSRRIEYYIPIKEDTAYAWSDNNGLCICTYDADKTFIERLTPYAAPKYTTTTFDEGVAFVRLCTYNDIFSNTFMFVEGTEIPAQFVPHKFVIDDNYLPEDLASTEARVDALEDDMAEAQGDISDLEDMFPVELTDTAFYEAGDNLFDASSLISGKHYGADGSEIGGNAGTGSQLSEEYIPVKGLCTWSTAPKLCICTYEADKTFIERIVIYTTDARGSYKFGASVRFVRLCSYHEAFPDDFMFMQGGDLPSEYAPYKYVVARDVLPTIKPGDTALFNGQVNLFDESQIFDGKHISSAGAIENYGEYNVDFIPAKFGDTFAFPDAKNTGLCVCTYDSDKTFIKMYAVYLNHNTSITLDTATDSEATPPVVGDENVAYIRLSIYGTSENDRTFPDNFMLVKGASLPEAYIPPDERKILPQYLPVKGLYWSYTVDSTISFSDGRLLQFYMPIARDKYVRVGFYKYDLDDGTGTMRNANTWRLYMAHEGALIAEGGGYTFVAQREIVNDGAWEMAVKIADTPNYIGSYHGYEKMTVASGTGVASDDKPLKIWIDGRDFDFTRTPITPCEGIDITLRAKLLLQGDPTTTIGYVTRRYHVSSDRITIKQHVEWTYTFTSTQRFMLMLPIRRYSGRLDSSTPDDGSAASEAARGVQITDRAMCDIDMVTYDVTRKGHNTTITGSRTGAHWCKVWGEDTGVCGTAKWDFASRFYVAATDPYNKMYSSYGTDSTLSITSGDVWDTTSEYFFGGQG